MSWSLLWQMSEPE